MTSTAPLDVDTGSRVGGRGGDGPLARISTALAYALLCAILTLLFVGLWAANTSLLTTGTVLGLTALVCLTGAILFIQDSGEAAMIKGGNNTKSEMAEEVTIEVLGGGTPSSLKVKVMLISLALLAAIFCIMAIVFIVGASREFTTYVPDQVLAALSSLTGAIMCLLVARGVCQTKIATVIPLAESTTCWTSCCVCCGLPSLIICAIIVMWSNTMDVVTMGIVPPGVLIRSDMGDPTLHLFCDGVRNSSLPTIVFLHGYGGSSRDAHGVRTDPRFTASGLRLCSLDRPGYGWSEGYSPLAHDKRHFGKIAEITLDVLIKQEITGDLVIMFHSLGGYHALALSAAIARQGFKDRPKPPRWRVRGMVAVDAMTPSWFAFDKPRPTDQCNVNVEPVSTGWFWPAVRVVTPTGLPRIVYATGFGGFSDSVSLYGKLADTMLNLNMRRKYTDSRLVESARWEMNCGYAIEGQKVLQEAAAGEFVALEVLVAIHGLNLTEFGAIASNSTAVKVQRIDLTGKFSGSVSQHEALMLSEEASREWVTPAVLRVARAVVETGG